MNIKISIMMGLFTILCLLTVGCEANNMKKKLNADDTSDIKNSNKNNEWYDKYNLKTNKITIATLDEYDELNPIIEVSNEQDIKLFIESVKFPSWKKVKPNDELKAAPDYHIILNNGTMLRTCSGIAYGSIMNYTEKNGEYTYSDYSGEYYLSEELLISVNKLIDKHKNND